MKRMLFCLALVAVLPLPNAFASNVDFSLGINIGNRPTVVPLPPTPVYQPAPVYESPRVYQESPAYQEDPLEMEAPPLFIQPPELGFHVAVGIPQDIFFYNNNYYLYQGNAWFISPYYQGPWHVTRYNSIPWVLRKHPTAKVRYYRDAGYRHYQKVRSPYWQRHHFRPQEMEAPPLFIQPPELGFHVAVGIPQDIFFYNNNYYLYQGNAWFISPYYQGPWHVTRYNSIPWVLRKHPTAKVRYYRDAGYRHYQKVRSPYWQRHHFRPQRESKEVRYKENKSWNARGERKQNHSSQQGQYHGRP